MEQTAKNWQQSQMLMDFWLVELPLRWLFVMSLIFFSLSCYFIILTCVVSCLQLNRLLPTFLAQPEFVDIIKSATVKKNE